MKRWSIQAWEAASGTFEEIKKHPFLCRLADGTLPYECFHRYISQDRLYLQDYTRALAHIASRLPEMDDVELFLRFASDGVAVEKALHEEFNPDTHAVKSQACEFYTSYLRARSQDDIAVEAAAVLPCFWIYLEAGKHLVSMARLDGNPYRDWIATYSDPAFEASTASAIEVCDRLAAASSAQVREQMTKVFADCARLEWLFWDSAYNPSPDLP